MSEGRTSTRWSELSLKASCRYGRRVATMLHLTLEVPDSLAQQLARLAAEQKKSVEQVALEQLTSVIESAAETLEEPYERFFRESGLFVEAPAEHERPDPPLSEEHLKELAAKLGAAGPLSEVIIEERGNP
jgi:hypothetical protein